MEACGANPRHIVVCDATITDLPSGWLHALVKHPHIGASELLNLFLAGVKPAHVIYQHASCLVTLVAIHGQRSADREVQQQRQWQQLAGLVEKLDASQCKLSLSVRGTLHCALPDGFVNAMCKLTCHGMAMGIASCERLRVFDMNKLVTLRFEDTVLRPGSSLHVFPSRLKSAQESTARCETLLFKLELAGFPLDKNRPLRIDGVAPAPPPLVEFALGLYGSRAYHIDLQIRDAEFDFTQLVCFINCPNPQSLNFRGSLSTADIASLLMTTPVQHIKCVRLIKRYPDRSCKRALQKLELDAAGTTNLRKLLGCVKLRELFIGGNFTSLENDGEFDWGVEEHLCAEQQLLRELQAVSRVTFMPSGVGLLRQLWINNVRSAELIGFLLQHSPATSPSVHLVGCSSLVTQHEHLMFPDHVRTVIFRDDPRLRGGGVVRSEFAYAGTPSPADIIQLRQESIVARIVEIQSWATSHCPGVKHPQLYKFEFGSTEFLEGLLKALKGRLLEVPGVTLSVSDVYVEVTKEQKRAFELLAATAGFSLHLS